MVKKNLLLGLGSALILSSTIPFALSCSLTKPNTKPDKPNNGGDKEPIDPSKPGGSGTTDSGGSLQPEEDNVILTELPRENIPDQVKDNHGPYPFAKLIKYTLQIPQIKINNKYLTLEQQKNRYKEVLEYLVGKSNSIEDIKTVFDNPQKSFVKYAQFVWDIQPNEMKRNIPKFVENTTRYFWNENELWRKEFFDSIGNNYALAITMGLMDFYIQIENMKQIGTFLAYYSWYKIKLIEATNQRGSAKNYFAKKERENALDAAKNALAIVGKYFNPLTGQVMGNKKWQGHESMLFFVWTNSKPQIIDNHIGYKYMVDVVNREIAPFVFALDNDADDMVAPFHKRDSENIFASVAGQKVKYKKDYTQEMLKKTWTKWFHFYKSKLNWQFDEE